VLGIGVSSMRLTVDEVFFEGVPSYFNEAELVGGVSGRRILWLRSRSMR
jgi:hypothetical protein